MDAELFTNRYPEGTTFNILGTEYILKYNSKRCQMNDAVGLCETYSKIIYLDLSASDSIHSVENLYLFFVKVLRHELMHGFFYEMGLDCYSHDEVLVDALAIKSDQIMHVLSSVK